MSACGLLRARRTKAAFAYEMRPSAPITARPLGTDSMTCWAKRRWRSVSRRLRWWSSIFNTVPTRRRASSGCEWTTRPRIMNHSQWPWASRSRTSASDERCWRTSLKSWLRSSGWTCFQTWRNVGGTAQPRVAAILSPVSSWKGFGKHSHVSKPAAAIASDRRVESPSTRHEAWMVMRWMPKSAMSNKAADRVTPMAASRRAASGCSQLAAG